MRLECLQALIDFVPIDNIPPRRQIFGAAIVVFQVVGMLPDIVAENGEQTLGKRVVLIRGGDDLHFAALFSGEPNPAAAELFDAGIVEFGLKVFEVAEGFGDRIGDGAGGIAAAFGLHDLPEHGVVDVASAIVADGGADVLGDGVEVADAFRWRRSDFSHRRRGACRGAGSSSAYR